MGLTPLRWHHRVGRRAECHRTTTGPSIHRCSGVCQARPDLWWDHHAPAGSLQFGTSELHFAATLVLALETEGPDAALVDDLQYIGSRLPRHGSSVHPTGPGPRAHIDVEGVLGRIL